MSSKKIVITGGAGFVGTNLIRLLLERTWNNLKQIMKDGALDSVTKELIYVAVSITNSCSYCTRSHTFAAKKKGASDEMIKEMIDVVGIANQNNKLVEAYQVEVDKIYK